ncbi:MAG TPA: putative lipoprotein [Myxococcota bacterium]|nr:putative lipoprotein [Myxococcota bacterium]
MRGSEGGFAAIALLLCVSGVACSSISDSSRSISRSMSSPSESSSEKQEDSMYKSKIRDYSYGYAKAGGDAQAFSRGIGALAQRRGIHDWEKDESTCRAIGEGFRDAGAGQSATANALNAVVPPKSDCGVWIRTGYHDRK